MLLLKETQMRKRRILLIALPALIAVIISITLLLSAPQTVSEIPPPLESTPETPPNLLVVPEVPLGTIAIVLACFFALLVAQKRSKSKLP